MGLLRAIENNRHGVPQIQQMKTTKKIETRIKNDDLVELRRKQIIEGAIKVFTVKGFHNATVREIAEESGLTMGTLYNYIATKDDIIYMVYDYITSILRHDVKTAIDSIFNPKVKLKAALRQNLKTVHQHQDIIMFIYKSSSFLDRESLHEVLARETEYIELFEDLLRNYFQGKKVDEKRLKLAADLLTYIPVIVTFRRWSLKHGFESMDEVMEYILDFVLQGIEFVLELPSSKT
jgi:TetR/AcrR family transcriptional regulator, cholesterol catabolism regulator